MTMTGELGKREADEGTHTQSKSATIALAVLSIYAVDFAINAGEWTAQCAQYGYLGMDVRLTVGGNDLVQSCCRSLIVDTLPIPKQQLGSAWGKCQPAPVPRTLVLKLTFLKPVE